MKKGYSIFIYAVNIFMLIIGAIAPYKGLELNELSWVLIGPFMVIVAMTELAKQLNGKEEGFEK